MAARVRETNRWDAVINGVNYRLKRAEGAYRKVSGRSQLEVQQMLNQAGNQFTSRRDLRPLFQTDWSGGAQWQKPLLSDQSIDTYYTATGFDLASEPGNIYPIPDIVADTSTFEFYDTVRPLQVSSEEIYWVDDNGGSGNLRVSKWNGSTFSHLTNRFGSTTTPYAMCWDADNSTIFLLTSSNVEYVTPDSAGGTVIAHGETITVGADIFMHFGRLLVWTGSVLLEVSDPLGTPAVTTIYTDALGADLLNKVAAAPAASLVNTKTPKLAVASSEGVWIVRNVLQNGLPVPFITRVDRTNDGTNVGVPVASLAPGTIVLDIIYHLGSVIVSTMADMTTLAINDITTGGYAPVTLYHLTNDSLGSIGTILGTRSPADSPYAFLGVDERGVYIGGHLTVWVYDPIRGGLHPWIGAGGATTQYQSMVLTTNAAGDKIQLYNRYGIQDRADIQSIEDEGGSTDTHTLESNYIDGNLPAELKSLVGITLMTDGIKANETWTVSIEADDAGSFTSAAVFDVDGTKTLYKALATAMTGYRFRYKIAWTATGDITAPSRVKGIVLHMVQGEMVTAWQLTLDLSEVRSVENTVLRPEDAVDSLETLMAKQAMTSYVDEFRLSSTTHDVRVDSVQVSRDAPLEGEATVVLTEQDLDN